MTSAKQIFVGSRRGPALPYDSEVEYLESTGTQWIDTGVLPTQDSVVRASGEMTTTSYVSGVTYGVFGCRDSSFQKYVGAQVYNGSMIAAFKNASVNPGDNTDRCTAPLALGQFSVSVSKAAREVSIGGTRYAVSNPTYCEDFRATMPIYLWGYNGTTFAIWPCRIKSFVVDGVRDMTPVRFTNEQGQSEGAMYDRVSGQLFRNSGTGAFGFGTDTAGGGYKCLGYSPWRFSRFSRLWKEAA